MIKKCVTIDAIMYTHSRDIVVKKQVLPKFIFEKYLLKKKENRNVWNVIGEKMNWNYYVLIKLNILF